MNVFLQSCTICKIKCHVAKFHSVTCVINCANRASHDRLLSVGCLEETRGSHRAKYRSRRGRKARSIAPDTTGRVTGMSAFFAAVPGAIVDSKLRASRANRVSSRDFVSSARRDSVGSRLAATGARDVRLFCAIPRHPRRRVEKTNTGWTTLPRRLVPSCLLLPPLLPARNERDSLSLSRDVARGARSRR